VVKNSDPIAAVQTACPLPLHNVGQPEGRDRVDPRAISCWSTPWRCD